MLTRAVFCRGSEKVGMPFAEKAGTWE